jgi:hypothetical protein
MAGEWKRGGEWDEPPCFAISLLMWCVGDVQISWWPASPRSATLRTGAVSPVAAFKVDEKSEEVWSNGIVPWSSACTKISLRF